MSKRQASSDPLPYVQVDRAVKPKATLLATLLGVTPQHATGSLVEFWELCGDPRELEAIALKTAPDQEPAVVLQAADLRLRFRLASGHDIEPSMLARLGLVEPRDGLFRVRGMSRYFEPIRRRIQAREAAAKGGKASVEKRRQAGGTAQPSGGKGSERRSNDAQPPAQPETEAEPKRPPKRNGSESEAESNPSVQRTAYSGQLLEEEAPLSPKTAARSLHIVEGDTLDGEAFFGWSQDHRTKHLGLLRERRAQSSEDLEEWFRSAARAVSGDVERLQRGFERFMLDPHWRPKGAPWAGWLKQWEGYVPAKLPGLFERPDTEAFRALAEHLTSLSGGEQPAYVLSQLAACSWHRDGESFIGETPDPYFADWCREQYAFPQVEVRHREAA